MAKLPTIVSNVPRDLRMFLDRVREAFNASGDGQLLTRGALRDAGLIDVVNGEIVPVAVEGEYSFPPAPANLTADGALANIILSWDTPTYRGHAYTEVWAAQEPTGGGVPDIGEAVLIGMSPGAVFSHNIGAAATRSYWVRFVNIADEVGPYNAVEGVQASTGQDPAYLLDLLSGQITESQLHQTLGERIDLIDADATVAGSVAARIAAEAAARGTAITSEETARQGADNALAQSITTLTSAVGSNTSAIQAEQTARASADSALSQSISTLQSTVNGNTAAIQAEATTRADADGALQAQYTVKVDVNGYVSGFGLASTAINATPTSEFIVRADTFAIASPSGPGIAPAEPFFVRTTPTTINGVSVPTGVYINDAFIQNGTITNAKIGNLEVDSAKIADAQITTAKIADASVVTAKIADAQITTAKIGDAQITNAKIVDLDAGKITAGSILSNQVVVSDRPLSSIVDEARTAGMVISLATVAERALWTVFAGSLASSSDSILGTSGLFTHTGSSPVVYSDAIYFTVPTEIALTHTGKRVRVTVLAKQPVTNASTQFAVMYSTGVSGSSGWRTFTPDNAFQAYSFYYTVPADSVVASYISIWADTASGGASVLVDRVFVEVSSEDFASDPAGRINAVATTIEGNRIRTGSMNADVIGAGQITSDFLRINTAMEIDAVNAGFVMGKVSAYDLQNDGIYLGRSQAQDGSTGFGFVLGRTQANGLNQFIQASKDDGLRVCNAGFFRDLVTQQAPQYFTGTQFFDLPPSTNSLTVQLIGGGKGGRGNVGFGGNGGLTRVRLYNGGTYTGVEWFSLGATGQNTAGNGVGQSSVLGTGGASGYSTTIRVGNPKDGYTEQTVYTEPGDATGWGAGGGGWDSPNFGGGAAQFVSASNYNIGALGLAQPRLEIIVGAGGAGGAGGSGSLSGGNGSQGLVMVQTSGGGLLPADVIPLAPTAAGTMTNQSFPNLGAGLWILQYDAGDLNIALGNVNVGQGVIMRFVYGPNACFVSSATPIGSAEFGARTVTYRFYKMGA